MVVTLSVLASVVQAQPYTLRYDASTGLRPTEGCPTWGEFIEGTGGATSVAGSEFTISNGIQFASLAYWVPVQFADPIVIEFRGRRPSGTTSSAARTHMGVIIGKGSSVGVHFFVGDDVIFLTAAGTLVRGAQANVDTDFPHTYRIEVSGSTVHVFYDGALTLTGSTFTSTDFGGPVIQWGDFTNLADGVSVWEYFQHNSSATDICRGAISGSASLTCSGSMVAAPGVAVNLLKEGLPFASTTTGGDGSFSFGGVPLSTYTVSVTAPTGYATPIGTRLVTVNAANQTFPVDPFPFTCLLGDIAGVVEGNCGGQTSELSGLTVDLFRDDGGIDVLVATAPTGAGGDYRFDDVALGDYTVGVVTPLGYTTSGAQQTASVAVPDELVTLPTFELTCQAITAQPRGMGYWKHQVNVYLTGKGSASETLDQLLSYIDLMVEHFNENLVNPVIVYVPGGTSTGDKLLGLQQLLTVNRGGTALDRSKQHLLALLLNVVSGKISQTDLISADGATVSQAITHCDNLVDGATEGYETARTIAEIINEGGTVPAGMIPLSTANIAYRGRRVLEFVAGPSPTTGPRTFRFVLARDEWVSLRVFDVAGRLVANVYEGRLGTGQNAIAWDGLATNGSTPSAGVYFARVSVGGEARIAKLIQLTR